MAETRESKAANMVDLKTSSFGGWLSNTYNIARAALRLAWFGPGTPLTPMAPPETAGRQYDYTTGANLGTTPKQSEGLTFNTLRALADTYDLLRLIIETRKDTICKLGWNIVYRDPQKKPDDRCKKIADYFASPDKEHDWSTWLRMLLEDCIVIDAATVYPRLANDGSVYGFEPVDGATIKRVIDERGRTPLAPSPAYQQILKGIPATDYTRDQLVYAPRNVRTNRIYGYSPVEQLVVSVSIALHRQAYQAAYYTEGSTPDLILAVPEGWTPQQIKQFKEYWDSLVQGTNTRRGTMFVYNGMDAINTKEKALTDEFDEWLARIMCFCFGISPAPFVKMMNRATSESAGEAAKEEGIEPYKQWVKSLMDRLLALHMGSADLCFQWQEEDETNPVDKAKIDDTDIRVGKRSVNEVRAANGLDPVAGGEKPFIVTAGGIILLEDAVLQSALATEAKRLGNEGTEAGNAAVASAGGKPNSKKDDAAGNKAKGKPQAKVKAKTKPAEKLQKMAAPRAVRKLASPIAEALAQLPAVITAQVAPYISAAKLHKAKPKKSKNAKMVASIVIDLQPLADMRGTVEVALTDVAKVAGWQALIDVGVAKGDDLFELVPNEAAAFARERATELLGTDATGGMLGESTRLLIRSTIAEALEKGFTVEELAQVLNNNYAFSYDRALTIADFEMRNALGAGELGAWKASKLVKGKEWLLSNDEGVCEICGGNAAQGVIPVGKAFQSGHQHQPAHPHCRCGTAPVTKAE